MRKSFLLLVLGMMLVLSAVMPAQALEAADIKGYNKSAGYQYVLFGSYPTDADGTVRPILWRVLRSQGGEAFLLSEYILFASPLHADYEHYNGWESSDLYAYLNSEFKDEAFSAGEQAALLVRTEDNALVTLITGDDMKDASIGFSSNAARQCESTAWAKRERDPKKLTLYIYSKGHKYSPWWSRTRSTDYQHQQRRVMDEGKIGRVSVGNPDLGVRPAIFVDLNQLTIASGNGTMASPYQLSADESVITVTPEPIVPTEAPVQTQPIQAPAAAVATPVPTAQPTQEPTQAPAVSKGYTAAADPESIHEKFPDLTAQGFLPEGEPEFVYQDDAAGLWLYASQTLRIEINRRTGTNSKKEPLRWYEAQVYTRDPSELFDFYPYDEARYKNRFALELADKIASKHKLVFAINSDYFIYRVGRDAEESYNYPIGLIIRDGEIFYESPKKPNSTVYPPLDVMALYPDGSVTLHLNGAKTGKELLAAGATDTLSFGPILVENGQVSPRSKEFGNTPNPRTAFGMVEPGYYICVMVESRIAESKGESCVWMGQKMAELGCTSAINLDGGATSTMIFMGKQINKSGNYGDITNRKQNELFGIGHSDAVK